MTQKLPAHTVFIGTPAYGGMLHTNFLHSILDFQRHGINFGLMTIGNESLITRARNTLVSSFHARTEFTHLLYLDGDVLVNGEDMARLVASGRDVIGAPVPLKTIGADGSLTYNVGRKLEREADGIHRVTRVGTAVMLLSRRAVTVLVDDAIAEGRVYHAPGDGPDAPPKLCFDVFGVGVRDGEYLSEDYWVCRRLIDLGIDIHVDPRARVRHAGTHQFG